MLIESGHHRMAITPPEPYTAVTFSFTSDADLLRCITRTTGQERQKRNDKEKTLLENCAGYVLVQEYQCCYQWTPYGSLLVDQVNGTTPPPLCGMLEVIKICAVANCIP